MDEAVNSADASIPCFSLDYNKTIRMRRIFSIFVLLAVAFTLTLPDYAMGMASDCCCPTVANSQTGNRSGNQAAATFSEIHGSGKHGEHCAHMHTAAKSNAQANVSVPGFRSAMHGPTNPCCCPTAASTSAIAVTISAQISDTPVVVSAGAYFQSQALSIALPLVNSERGPPTQH